jgi:tetratricopeptide (TPR) repeat protein
LLTKETVIVLPLLLIAYNALFKRPLFPASLWTFFAVIAAYLGLRAWALDASVAIAPQLEGFRFLFEFVAGYVKLLLLPWPLDYFFSVQPEAVVSMPEAVGWWAFLLAVCGWALRYRQREPLIAFGVIWIVVTLSPSLVWAFHEVPVFAVRYLYPPSIGLALIVARGFQLAKIRWPAATTATAAAVALAYAAIVVVKNGDWRNEERFFLSALAVPTQHDEYYGPPLALLGKYYYEHNRPEAAIQYFTEAEKIGDLFTKVFCNESIGLIHGERGDYVRSTEYYTRAYQLDPSKSSVLIGLGNNAFATQDARQALHYYTLAYEADKNNRAASYNLSLVYATLGDAANAMRFRRIAESISDEFVQ